MKSLRKWAAVGGLAGAAVFALAIPAQAAEGDWLVKVSGCNVHEQVELQGSPKHDYMRFYTTGGSQYCQADIVDLPTGNTYGTHFFDTNGSYYSAWYYDGPGHDMSVCVTGFQVDGCGPDN